MTPPEPALAPAVAGVLRQAKVGRGRRVCVALSGGVDSVVLLDVLDRLRDEFSFSLEAAHVHHGLSAHADDWARFCEQLCAARGIALHRFAVEVPRDDPQGLEAAARRLRHAVLAGVDCDWLVFGHHLDDQAETVLFRLARGTGVRGAAGMQAIDRSAHSEGAVRGRLRPLLRLRRQAIVAYARARGLAWIEDDSNADPRFTRNYLRHEVMPALAHAFPGVVESLGRAADNFREADSLLVALAEIDRAQCEPQADGSIDQACLLRLPDARVFNLLRALMGQTGLARPARGRLIEAVRQLRVAAGRALHLPLGEAACCAYRGRVWIEALEGGQVQAVAWQGEDVLPWGAGAVVFARGVGEGVAAARLEAAGTVTLAPRWPGLMMRAGPGRPRRSLRKLCQDAGLPAWLRAGMPILRVDGEAAWIGGLGVGGDFACAPDEPGVRLSWRRAGVVPDPGLDPDPDSVACTSD